MGKTGFNLKYFLDKLPNSNRGVSFVFWLSGFFGFSMGWLYSRYQAAIDYAQALANIVPYPHNNPFYLATVKGWSILTQLSALFLKLGVSEKMLSYFLSGIVGAVSFQALAIAVLALSNNVKFSILSSFFIFFLHGIFVMGINYSISLMGVDGTFGMMALSFPFLVVSLIAIGQYKLGGLFLGLLPSVHPAQGFWYTLVIFICLLWDFNYHKDGLKRALKYIIFGYVISIISLIYQLSVYDVPKIDPSILSKYKYALLVYWGYHLQRFNLFSAEMSRAIFGLGLSLWGLLTVRKLVPRNSLFLIRSFIVAGLFAGIFSLVYWLPKEMIADKLYNLAILQPNRLFNYILLGSMVLLLGFLGNFIAVSRFVQLNLLIFVIGLAAYRFFYSEKLNLSIDAITIAFMLASGLALVASSSPFSDNFNNLGKGKFIWLRLNLVAFLITLYYSLTPIFNGDYNIALVAITISILAMVFSMLILNREGEKNNYRLIFTIEAILLAVFGLFWLMPSARCLSFARFGLYKLFAIFVIYIGAFSVLLAAYLPLSKASAKISRAFGHFWLRLAKVNFNVITFSVLILIVPLVFQKAISVWKENQKTHFYDWEDDSVYNQLYRGQGMVLAGPGVESWFSVRTRRPSLYYGTPQLVIYALEAGPGLNRIFQNVYGVDFLNPPEESLVTGLNIPEKMIKILWEARTEEQWQKIKEDFEISDVVTLSGWKLKLPEVIRNRRLVLYKIP